MATQTIDSTMFNSELIVTVIQKEAGSATYVVPRATSKDDYDNFGLTELTAAMHVAAERGKVKKQDRMAVTQLAHHISTSVLPHQFPEGFLRQNNPAYLILDPITTVRVEMKPTSVGEPA